MLYEDVFPSVIAELCDPPIPYHRGSPYGGKGWDTADPTIGDVHQWDIWGGKEWPWQECACAGGHRRWLEAGGRSACAVENRNIFRCTQNMDSE